MAAKEKTKSAKSELVKNWVLPIAIMLIVGGGVGFGVGTFVLAPRMEVAMAAASQDPAAEAATEQTHNPTAGSDHDTSALAGLTQKIVDLEPITVNLAVPNNIWMRMQIAVQASSTVSDGTLNDVQQDILAYVQQLRLDQIRSPNGYLRIKDDLARRAEVRSGGGISDLYIRTLVFE
ncbi:flagellar basal body-associated FliL family protein [Notoacmeibacter ruber]|uniref:Flagellar protein FliL n=1 Tax=Notoacmeibacter ruber TaxID=2670375 RepID=A0A3L7JDI9_9HYPH|nr:flagellar basal body-associated FliL family protein [Notoacmeibacter ruber]RLQ88827.1 hypothetical protein D8780_11970 [Notoacmeibacter ruber]